MNFLCVNFTLAQIYISRFGNEIFSPRISSLLKRYANNKIVQRVINFCDNHQCYAWKIMDHIAKFNQTWM